MSKFYSKYTGEQIEAALDFATGLNIQNGEGRDSLMLKPASGENVVKGRASAAFGRYLQEEPGAKSQGYNYMFGYSNRFKGDYSMVGGGNNMNPDPENPGAYLPIEGENVFIYGVANEGYAHTNKAEKPADFTSRRFYAGSSIGWGNINRGQYNHLIGNKNEIGDTIYYPQSCILMGSRLYAHFNGQIILGHYNEKNKWISFAIGDGTSDDNRHNAFEIDKENSRSRCYPTNAKRFIINDVIYKVTSETPLKLKSDYGTEITSIDDTITISGATYTIGTRGVDAGIEYLTLINSYGETIKSFPRPDDNDVLIRKEVGWLIDKKVGEINAALDAVLGV